MSERRIVTEAEWRNQYRDGSWSAGKAPDWADLPLAPDPADVRLVTAECLTCMEASQVNAYEMGDSKGVRRIDVVIAAAKRLLGGER